MAPFTMMAVNPSMPADAPLAAFPAACSMLDKPVLMLLIEALALFTSTSTTSSSLLSEAMVAAVEWSYVKGDAKALDQEKRRGAQGKRL